MSDFAFTDYTIGAKLILSDGTRTLDLVGAPPVGIYLTEFNPPIVADENTFASSPDMEGGIRTRTKPENPTGSGRLRIDQSASSAVSYWADVDNLQDLIRSAHRNKGTIAYTPTGGTEVTYDLEAIRITEMIHDFEVSKRRMWVGFEFVAKPYGRLAEVTIVASDTLTTPIDSLAIADVPGHVDARGVLVVTDADGQVRDDIEWGIDENTAESLRTTAANLVVTGYAGTFDVDHVEATVPPSWVAVCATPAANAHVGRYRIKARCTCPATDTQVRLTWRSGEAPWTSNLPAIAHIADAAIELDLGVINIVEMEGTHAWTGRVEIQGATLDEFQITDLLYIPADRYGRARGSQIVSASSGGLTAADNFDAQTSGNVSGKTAQLGGDWSGAGDADDFTVDTANGWIQRTAVSDASNVTGRYLRLGIGDVAQVEVRADIYVATGSLSNVLQGVFARYVDVNNWLIAQYSAFSSTGSLLSISKRVAGSATSPAVTTVSIADGAWRTLVLAVTDDGDVSVAEGPRGGSLSIVLTLTADSDLATGGALDDGGFGIYDANIEAGAATRRYDDFSVTAPTGDVVESNRAIYPNQSLRLDYRSAQRENAAGTRWGDVPNYTDRRLFIPPATRNDNTSRLVVKQDRNDLSIRAVAGVSTDDLTATLTVEPRVLLTS